MKSSFLLALLIFTQGAFAQILPTNSIAPLPRPSPTPMPTPKPNTRFLNKYGLCLDALKAAYVASDMAPPFFVSPTGQITLNVDGMAEIYTEYGVVKATKSCSFDSSKKIDDAIEILTRNAEFKAMLEKHWGTDKGAKIQTALDACKAHETIQKNLEKIIDKSKTTQKNSSGTR